MIARLALTGGLAWGAVLFTTGCEDKTLGRSCDVTVDVGVGQGAWNTKATDSRARSLSSHRCNRA